MTKKSIQVIVTVIVAAILLVLGHLGYDVQSNKTPDPPAKSSPMPAPKVAG